MIRFQKIIAGLLFSVGALILLSLVLPLTYSLLRFQFFSPPRLIDPTAVSAFPIPQVVNIFGVSTVDYSNPQAWFDAPPVPPSASGPAKYFTLSLPRLHLADITVEVNGTDLKKNAIHYSGSALPGSFGNTVIFGHSALPLFYKKGSPLTIFNPLPSARVGDEAIVKYDGITYRYVIRQTLEVTPEEISVLAQHYDRHELTLITCVPLGTYWHRFVATAELVN